MIAKQSVYLTADRSKAVPESDPEAKFLLVREGHEIEEALVEKHSALDLVNSASKAKPAEPAPSREHMPPANPAPDTAPAAKKKGGRPAKSKK